MFIGDPPLETFVLGDELFDLERVVPDLRIKCLVVDEQITVFEFFANFAVGQLANQLSRGAVLAPHPVLKTRRRMTFQYFRFSF